MIRYIVICLMALSTLSFAEVKAPQLKYAGKGGGPYLMDGAYAGSPAVVDLDGDGRQEIIWANYMIYVIDGATGSPIWNLYTGHDKTYRENKWIGRTYPAVAVADIDGNGDLEIVTGHEHGYISVYDHDGYFHSKVWPKQLCTSSEIRSLCIADLDHDGNMEILAGSTRQGSYDHDWYILRNDGQFYAEWPQTALHHCNHGAFNQNMAVADIDHDGRHEIVALADVFYIHAFQDDGEHMIASEIYGNKIWADIPLWFNYDSELRGWGDADEFLPKFPFSAPIIVDVNNDMEMEVVVISYIHDQSTTPGTPLYHTPIILAGNRSRFNKNGFDWHSFPVPKDLEGNKSLCEDWQITKVCMPNPVAADLDRDGFMEIFFPANDGNMHVYWLDKTEHHHWPYAVTKPEESIIRFASEPVVADLDNDGSPEVIFGSWTPKHSQCLGKLHILDSFGNVLHEVSVPQSSRGWNGITSAPTIANIDNDPDFELVVGTEWTGICAYDLPATANAKIYWQTGQCNFQRTGSFLKENNFSISSNDYNIPVQFTLSQNYPNPFNDATIISFELAYPVYVRLDIYDILCRKITTLLNEHLDAGTYNYPLVSNQLKLNSGIYFCRLKVEDSEKLIKMVLLH